MSPALVQDLAEEQLGALGLRVVEELFRLVLLDDLALVHEDHAVGDLRAKPISWVTHSMVMPVLGETRPSRRALP
jgi:hypothetical protein